MHTSTKFVIKRQLSQRDITLEYCDDKMCRYTVTDYFESKMVEEPRFFDFKRYYGYMTIILISVFSIYFYNEKLYILLYSAAFFISLFFWIISHSDRVMKFEDVRQLNNL